MNIHKITFPKHLARAQEMQTFHIDLDRVIAVDGPHTDYNSIGSSRGYQYYSKFTIYTDVADRAFELVINDATSYQWDQLEKLKCAEERHIPECEKVVTLLVEVFLSKWGK